MSAATKRIARPKQPSRRVKFTAAWEMLGISRMTLESMLDDPDSSRATRKLFTVQQDHADGVRYLLRDELELWLGSVGSPEEREAALRQYRESKGRIRKPA